MGKKTEPSKLDILALDYDGKQKALIRIAQDLLDLQIEYASVSGRHAELSAKVRVLKEVKSALQSALRAENLS